MFDHADIHVRDLDVSKRFYSHVLAPLGFTLSAETSKHVEFRRAQHRARGPADAAAALRVPRTHTRRCGHIPRCGCRGRVREQWHAGLREYAPDYYAAFLHPDAHIVEAVHRDPQTRRSWTCLRWEP